MSESPQAPKPDTSVAGGPHNRDTCTHAECVRVREVIASRQRNRDNVAALLRAHGQAGHDQALGVFTCRCGWAGGFLSVHQADQLVAAGYVR